MAESAGFKLVSRSSAHLTAPSPAGGRSAAESAGHARSPGGQQHLQRRLRPSGLSPGETRRKARPSAVLAEPVRDALRDVGRPLAVPLRREMEERLGADLSAVRVHTGSTARASAAAVRAKAYTSGSHVVIGDGGADRRTLAHELVHVIQQHQGPVAGTDYGDGLRVSSPSDRFEREAEAAAGQVASTAWPGRAWPAAVTRLSAGTGRGPGHASGAVAVQRVITLGQDALEWAEAKKRLQQLASAEGGGLKVSAIPDAELNLILQYLSEVNYSATDPPAMLEKVGQVSSALPKFHVPSIDPKDWAVLHRLRGTPKFGGFMAAHLGKAEGDEETRLAVKNYIASDAKYEPANFGGPGHTWEKNLDWLLHKVKGRKVVLTELPLRQANIMSKVDESGQPIKKGQPLERSKAGQVSAYAREIAYFLAEGYVCLLGDAVPEVPNGAYVMVPGNDLPGEMVKVLSADRYVDREYMRMITAGGQISPEKDAYLELLQAFAIAGLPTNPPVGSQERVRLVHEGRAKAVSVSKARQGEQAADQRRQIMAAAMEAKLKSAKEENNELLKPQAELTAWLLPNLIALERDYQRWAPSGSQLNELIGKAQADGLIGKSFTKNAMKDFIEKYVRDDLPRREKK